MKKALVLIAGIVLTLSSQAGAQEFYRQRISVQVKYATAQRPDPKGIARLRGSISGTDRYYSSDPMADTFRLEVGGREFPAIGHRFTSFGEAERTLPNPFAVRQMMDFIVSFDARTAQEIGKWVIESADIRRELKDRLGRILEDHLRPVDGQDRFMLDRPCDAGFDGNACYYNPFSLPDSRFTLTAHDPGTRERVDLVLTFSGQGKRLD